MGPGLYALDTTESEHDPIRTGTGAITPRN